MESATGQCVSSLDFRATNIDENICAVIDTSLQHFSNLYSSGTVVVDLHDNCYGLDIEILGVITLKMAFHPCDKEIRICANLLEQDFLTAEDSLSIEDGGTVDLGIFSMNLVHKLQNHCDGYDIHVYELLVEGTSFGYQPIILPQCYTNFDVKRCGTTETVCEAPPNGVATCIDGECGISCENGFGELEGSCVDLSNNSNNCGSLNNKCPVPTNGEATCALGQCGISCDTDYEESGDICIEITSTSKCGSIDNECVNPLDGQATCNSGSCGFTCNSGYGKSGSSCVSLSTTSNCGSVGNICSSPSNGDSICNSGACDVSCNPGYGKSGSSCVSLSTISNCGSLGKVCSSPASGYSILWLIF